jgi:KDO2-lipid IV(A) lauroyltransferase
MTRLALGLMWAVHFLPLTVLAALGRALGVLLYVFGRERRAVTQINLALCFPQLDKAARAALARRHFRALGRSVFERGLLWWASQGRIQRLVRIEGIEHWQAQRTRPVIFLAPHFIGLEMGGARLQLECAVVSIYSRQKNAVFDAVLLRGRKRFARAPVFSRQEGVRPVLRALRKGLSFYYLPDMDFGARDALFVPFFGVPAATVTGLSRIAALSGAAVVPCVTRQLPGGEGYVLRFYPAWEQFPSTDLAADVRRMNEFIEERVREMPEQYYWVHKRFKTRPAGEPNPYDRDARCV